MNTLTRRESDYIQCWFKILNTRHFINVHLLITLKLFIINYLGDTSGEEEQDCWFGEGGCLESSEMESGTWRDCC